jgi:hypothetical protein
MSGSVCARVRLVLLLRRPPRVSDFPMTMAVPVAVCALLPASRSKAGVHADIIACDGAHQPTLEQWNQFAAHLTGGSWCAVLGTPSPSPSPSLSPSPSPTPT